MNLNTFESTKKMIFQKIVETSTILVFVLDEQFRMLYCNHRAESVLNISSKESFGNSIFNLPINWDSTLLKNALKPVETTFSSVSLPDLTLQQPGQRDKIIGCTYSRISEENSDILYIFAGQDITEKRSIEYSQRISENLQALGRLASGISHELVTPVQFVKDNLTYLKKKLTANLNNKTLNETDLLEVTTEAMEGMQQILSLTGALKNFTHPGDEEPQIVDIDKVINDAVVLSRGEWKYQTKLSYRALTPLPSFHCYPNDLTRVLINMIVNSAQAVAMKNIANGWIAITAEVISNAVKIEISDNGPGISKEVQEKMFEPFFTTKPRGIGTGQGLSFAYSTIVGKCGGRISYRDHAEGGSIFSLLIPIKAIT